MPRRPGRSLLVGAALVLTIGAAASLLGPRLVPDSGWYTMAAEGRAREVPQPFAGRVLHPWLVRGLAEGADLELTAAFRWIALLSLLGLGFGGAELLRRSGVRPELLLALVPGYLLLQTCRAVYLPDLLHAALVALALLALSGLRRPLAGLPLLLAQVAKESTLLLALATAFVAGRRRRFLTAGVAAAAALSGWLLVAVLTAGTQNTHGIALPAYAAMKMAHCFLRNVGGLETWVDTLDYCLPVARWSLPEWLPAGRIREIGICGFSLGQPLHLAFFWCSLFGVAPALAWARVVPDWRAGRLRPPLWLASALAYGLLSWLLAPLLGTSLDRLVGYAWPAFWLAVPVLVLTAYRPPARELALIAPLHLLLAWSPALLELPLARIPLLLAALAAAIALQAAAWRIWRRWQLVEAGSVGSWPAAGR